MLSWLIRYKNGKEIKSTKEYTYEDIDREQLDAFCIFDTKTDMPLITVHFDDSRKKLIYRRRTEMPTAKRPFLTVCHILGWHMNVKGESVQNINYVYEVKDKVWIESAGKWDRKRSNWFYSPNIREYEK